MKFSRLKVIKKLYLNKRCLLFIENEKGHLKRAKWCVLSWPTYITHILIFGCSQMLSSMLQSKKCKNRSKCEKGKKSERSQKREDVGGRSEVFYVTAVNTSKWRPSQIANPTSSAGAPPNTNKSQFSRLHVSWSKRRKTVSWSKNWLTEKGIKGR
jgi:hypothetical protein